jgi:cyclopropane-fatty-acyl-phospholipid synthase
VLEIGCGWVPGRNGDQEFDASLVGVTLSTEQLAWANERMAKQGVADKDRPAQDYRDIGKTTPTNFDAICSIEMIGPWASSSGPVLSDGGTSAQTRWPRLHQSIVIADCSRRYVDSTDFIQQYIFPGGCLPARVSSASRHMPLRHRRRFSFGQDYAHTLKLWRDTRHKVTGASTRV